jgi:hypothetical protein
MQRVVETSDRPHGIAEGRMSCDVSNSFPVDVHFSPVAQACDVFRPREWARLIGDEILGSHGGVLMVRQ